MLASELAGVVDELEHLGIKFTVIPRLDGSLRLNCWRLPSSWNNRQRINHLLAQHVENSPENAAHIAEFIKTRPTLGQANLRQEGRKD